ncbi:tagatose-6-phosphate kinase-like protein [Leptomonas pyrrhocoris]|uniref:Tagatose-6-phosphate kinase-like protein n=1 Tax=Leptomonas pyrrhocoris TaxID=157538 RepID=A0A0M9G0L4_LEPPY|nr:tagatose-6-phosphate kinase-like protein [Leptomonas pyrrhocoris]XP_015658233.1 tagatose-6-phosphate kinase-like protein [Leptomonas pyrrhocoris]XP_015658234.1 tagatose-6-phosphate kinase-like protein [Leptomonas pyrrhocoris]KPA79793.1 tagatose-6-phosphate kinase-like protein [Leptomonas pyrrhocoris]KPA79794.1 tagatose-6-phosphate kinase-like protein [Leptomonas pyrrhocoris]KPA79795.1 tagatose-6-phosphate kinase-like protein [Leptomonas pyrrhocoris]|eukprot:XP_015658232.1 tagatose-6-phosphate kinase-like protein [Leptomonas pyrrhocoris]
MSSSDILVVGPNPALQKTLTFGELRLDAVNRASAIREYTGGKGTNFCRASACFKASPNFCNTTLFTFVGGETGKRVVDFLKGEDIAVHPISVPGETRTCVTCLDEKHGTMTEIIEPSYPVPAESAGDMDRVLKERLQHAGGLAIMGSLPDHTSPELYTRWTQMAAEAKKPVLLDAIKGIEASLKVPNVTSILKVNMEELYKLTGKSTPESAFAYAMREWTVHILAVTDGPRSAYIQERGKALHTLHVPRLDSVVSPLGAGDTADAIFFAQYIHGVPADKAFRFALAAASANCFQKDAGKFEHRDMVEIAKGVTIE